MLKTASLSFLMFFFLNFTSYSEEFNVDMLIRGVNQAGLALHSGEVTAITTVKRPASKSEAEIDAWIQAEQEQELKGFTPDPLHPHVDAKKYETDYLIPKLNFRANSYRQRSEIDHSVTLFQYVVPPGSTRPTVYQYKMTTIDAPNHLLNSQTAQFLQAGVFFLLAYDGNIQVKQEIGNITFAYPSSHAAQIFSRDKHGGFVGFRFGRSLVPPETKLIGKENIDGSECYILAFTSRETETQLWVDTSIDFCSRKVKILRSTPERVYTYVDITYKQFERFGDIWFPRITERTVYQKDQTIRLKRHIEVISAEFNIDFPNDFFQIDRDFYLQQSRRHSPDMGFLPDSGISPILTSTEMDTLLLLCGPQSLSRICELLKVNTNLSELKKLSGFDSNRGTTMLGLKEAATYKGLAPNGVKASIELLRRKKVPLPAIAYVNNNHFLVFETVDKEGVKVSDPAQKYAPHIGWSELTEMWDGDLLIFDKKKARRTKQKETPLAFTDAPEYNFGKVLGGSRIKHAFTIKNIGQKPLKILSVKETCACTASVLSKNEILPGKTGDISAVLTVPSGNQQVKESLLVLTDDPVQSTLTLTLKGEAFIPLKTFPERLAFGNQKPLQTPLTKRVSLHLQEGVELLSIRTDSEHLKATLQTEAGIPYVALKFLPTLPIGQFSHNLLIDYTYKGEQTTHNVLVFGEVLGELHVVPNRLFFGLIKDPSAAAKTITISSRNSQPFQITDVESGTQAVKVTINEGEGETHYQVTTSLASKAAPGEFSGEIIIHTSSRIQPTVRVPFFGIITDSN